MTVSAAMGTIRATLQRFTFFLVTDHTSDDQCHRTHEKQSYYCCAHFSHPFRRPTSPGSNLNAIFLLRRSSGKYHFAVTTFFISTFNVLLA